MSWPSRWLLKMFHYFRGDNDEFFVDSVNGSDSNGGKSWSGAFQTIAAAVAAAAAGDIIYIKGSFNEEVTVSLAGLRIVGCGNRPKEAQWTADADETCLTIAANYVEISNIYFRPPAYSADATCAAIALSGANHAHIHHCRFQGKTASYNAIYSAVCDSDNVHISDCEFQYMNTATYGAAILGAEAGGLSYSAWIIERNIFMSCVIGVNICGRVCVVRDNVFMEYGITAAGAVDAVCTLPLDLSGTNSGGNAVYKNLMAGDYSTARYKPGASGDYWGANFCEDNAEAEVGDNGLSIDNPAA